MLMVALCLLKVLANPAFAGETVVIARDSPDYVRNPMSPQIFDRAEGPVCGPVDELFID
jgi:hypothetical protein